MRLDRSRLLQIGLGVLWLLDGALQLQPFMFTRGFAQSILSPAAAGTPWLVGDPIRWVATQVAAHPLPWNLAFALTQLALGAGVLWRRTTRVALVASVAWGLGVWWLGEGVGGLSGGGTFLTGAPGAALLYVVIAVLAWPADDPNARLTRQRLGRWAWATLWLLVAVVELHELHPRGVAAAIVAALAVWTFMLSVPGDVELLVASIVLGVGVGLVVWSTTQGFGELSSGQATDPNLGPPVILMAIAAFSPRARGAAASSPPGALRLPGHFVRRVPAPLHASRR